MKDIHCWIRSNWHGGSKDKLQITRIKVFPYLLETYPDVRGRNKYLQRRDFECRTIKEAENIAIAVYGNRANIIIGH